MTEATANGQTGWKSQAKKNLFSVTIILSKIGGKLLSVLAKLAKFAKVGLAVASFASYTYMYTWKFAVMLMVMLFVHESGHVWAMKRWGVPTKGFYFIPFIGGAAVATARPPTRWSEVYIALMGPIWGGGLALVAALIYAASHHPLWAAIAAWMAMINVFNLLPINPLDGGRVFRSIAFSLHHWIGFCFLILGVIALLVLSFWIGVGFLVTILLIGGSIELAGEFRWVRLARSSREAKAYHDKIVQNLADTIQKAGMSDTEDARQIFARFKALEPPVIYLPTDMKWPVMLGAFGSYLLVAGVLFLIMYAMNHVPGAVLAFHVLRD